MSDRLPIYEAHVEPDEGFRLGSGERWRGYRVRYRQQGARRWRTFLLDGLDRIPSVEELQRYCHAHATGDLSVVSRG